MPIRFLLTIMLAVLCTSAHAQKESVVLDMETKMPVSGVVVTVNNAVTSQLLTNYRGLFLLPAAADSIVLGHPGYESLRLRRAEVTDTILLLRKYQALREVVIYGSMPSVGFSMGKLREQLRKEDELTPRAVPLATFDFFSVFSAKKRKKTRERLKAIENY